MFDHHCHAGSSRARQHPLILIFLLFIVVTRVIVPPGFMPSPVTSAHSFSLFELCGGDSQSAQLLDAWQDGHAMGHSAEHHSASHGFEFCEFDALSLTLAESYSENLMPFFDASAVADVPLIQAAVTFRSAKANHPVRAPPPRFA